jgi:hypothetical protein
MVLYPSEQWLHEYCRALNESDDFEAFGFSEDVLLVVTDLRLDEFTIGDLSGDALDGVPADVRERLSDMTLAEAVDSLDGAVRSSLPESIGELVDQADRYVENGTIFVYIELDRGSCFGPALVDDPSALEYSAVFRAPAKTWQSIVAGRPAAAAVASGDLEIFGNRLLLVKHLAELQLLCDIAAEDVDSEFLFPTYERSLCQFVLDESLRKPIHVQKELTRETALALRSITPF